MEVLATECAKEDKNTKEVVLRILHPEGTTSAGLVCSGPTLLERPECSGPTLLEEKKGANVEEDEKTKIEIEVGIIHPEGTTSATSEEPTIIGLVSSGPTLLESLECPGPTLLERKKGDSIETDENKIEVEVGKLHPKGTT